MRDPDRERHAHAGHRHERRARRDLLVEAGHRVVAHAILPDEPARVRAQVEACSRPGACDAIVVNGGTGLAPRDTTYEAIAELLEKRLDGFGELFRMLSYEQIGAAAMLSRAVAGVASGRSSSRCRARRRPSSSRCRSSSCPSSGTW